MFHWLINWFHYFYVPSQGPWYTGNVWGNLFVVLVLAPLGYLWSKTKFWPIKPLNHLATKIHDKLDKHIEDQRQHRVVMEAHAEYQSKLIEEAHHLLHTGKHHPRVKERFSKDGSHTPSLPAIIEEQSPTKESN